MNGLRPECPGRVRRRLEAGAGVLPATPAAAGTVPGNAGHRRRCL